MTRCLIRAGLFWWAAGAGLLPAADLAFERLSLHQFDDGPPVAAGYEHLPGEGAWFGTRISGFATDQPDPESENRHMKISWTAQPLDPAGVALVEPLAGEIEETLRSQDEAWLPKVMVPFTIPPFAPAGSYRIEVTVHDHIAGKDLTGELTFKVRGEPMVTATSLGIRDFRFLANETDRFGLRPAIYSPGDTLFARFEIVGYQFAANNRFEVEYGITILAGEKEMFSQAEAARDSNEGFYPQRWVPGGFSLNLTSDLKPGMFTVKLTLRDRVAGTAVEVNETFEVR